MAKFKETLRHFLSPAAKHFYIFTTSEESRNRKIFKVKFHLGVLAEQKNLTEQKKSAATNQLIFVSILSPSGNDAFPLSLHTSCASLPFFTSSQPRLNVLLEWFPSALDSSGLQGEICGGHKNLSTSITWHAVTVRHITATR